MGKNTAKTILNTMKASGVEVSEEMEKQLEEADLTKDPDAVNKLMMKTGGEIAGKSGIVITSYSIHYTKLYESETELETRRKNIKEWKPKNRDRQVSKALKLYASNVSNASHGAVRKFI